jgi:hypothetical protein
VSLFDRILLRKIYDNNGTFTLLVIANGVARELEVSTNIPIAPEIESDDYETPQEVRESARITMNRDLPTTVTYSAMT